MTTPIYDRELIARMLADYMWPDKIAGRAYRVEAIQKQIDALNAADNADAAGVRTVNATDPVRALLAQLRHEVEQDKGWDYTEYERGRLEEKRRSIQLLEAALAQQPEAPAQEAVASLARRLARDAWHAAHVAPCSGREQMEWAIADIIRPHLATRPAADALGAALGQGKANGR